MRELPFALRDMTRDAWYHSSLAGPMTEKPAKSAGHLQRAGNVRR